MASLKKILASGGSALGEDTSAGARGADGPTGQPGPAGVPGPDGEAQSEAAPLEVIAAALPTGLRPI